MALRKEPFTVGSYVHVYNRGNRKLPIVNDDNDRWRFLQALRYFNDVKSSTNILRDLTRKKRLVSDTNQIDAGLSIPESVFGIGWPEDWPNHKPLVKILCYCLMPNHFHLLIKEIRRDGTSKFMQKLGIGYTNYFNIRHGEVGRIFQGPYKARVVDSDLYIKYLSVYIQIINTFEIYGQGDLKLAFKNLNKALDFSINYPFCSTADYLGGRKSLIIDKDILGEFFPTIKSYKEFVYDSIKAKDLDDVLGSLKLD